MDLMLFDTPEEALIYAAAHNVRAPHGLSIVAGDVGGQSFLTTCHDGPGGSFEGDAATTGYSLNKGEWVVDDCTC